MGTTVTTNIGLIKPDLAEKIQEDLPTFAGWADQNADNCDTIDALFRDDSTTFTLTLTADSVNPTPGASALFEGKYVRLWPRLVIVFFRIYVGGAGFAAGTGDYKINLPFAMDATLIGADGNRLFPVGKCLFRDASSALTSSVFLLLYDPAATAIRFQLAQGDLLADTHPVSQDDRLSGYFMYPTSAA